MIVTELQNFFLIGGGGINLKGSLFPGQTNADNYVGKKERFEDSGRQWPTFPLASPQHLHTVVPSLNCINKVPSVTLQSSEGYLLQ